MRYRSLSSISPWEVVLPTSRKVPRVSRYSGSCRSLPPSDTGPSPSKAGFPKTVLLASVMLSQSITPACFALRFRLFPFRSPLLRKSMFLSLPPGNEMFQFPGFPSMRYGLAHGWRESFPPGFPIQRSADRWICAPPRSLSQLVTSFFGSQCQGIHPAPLSA